MTLYCPTCGYNLTGLPENRCPECGNSFDPAKLARRAAHKALTLPRPIRLRALLGQLFILPGGFLLLTCFSATTVGETAFPLVILSGLALLLGGAPLTDHLARRLFVTRALERGQDPAEALKNLWAVSATAIGLYICQLAIAIGGCGIAGGVVLYYR